MQAELILRKRQDLILQPGNPVMNSESACIATNSPQIIYAKSLVERYAIIG